MVCHGVHLGMILSIVLGYNEDTSFAVIEDFLGIGRNSRLDQWQCHCCTKQPD
jgi:hypothetical protein